MSAVIFLTTQAEPCREGDFRSTRLRLWALIRGHSKILRGPQGHHEVYRTSVICLKGPEYGGRDSGHRLTGLPRLALSTLPFKFVEFDELCKMQPLIREDRVLDLGCGDS